MIGTRPLALIALLLGAGATGCGSEPGVVPMATAGPGASEAGRASETATLVATLSVEGMT